MILSAFASHPPTESDLDFTVEKLTKLQKELATVSAALEQANPMVVTRL